MPIDYDLTNESTIIKLVHDIESNDVRLRREDEYRSYKVCNGAQKEYMLTKLQKQFPETWDMHSHVDVSIGKKIIDKLSKAYKEKPIRELESDQDTEIYADICEDGSWTRAWQDFDKDFNRQKYAMMWVTERDGNLGLTSLKGFESFVVRDQNSGEVKLVCLNYPDYRITSAHNVFAESDSEEQIIAESQDDTSARHRVFVFWTADQHASWHVSKLTNAKGESVTQVRHLKNPENPNDVNPLGILPFVFVSQSSSVDLPFMNSLAEQSVEVALELSHLHTAAVNQGFGQLVLKMPEDSHSNTVHAGIFTALSLRLIDYDGPQPDAEYLNPSPDLAGMRETFNNTIQMILSENGITTGALGNDAFNSGLERLIAQADVQDKISENQQIYAEAEQQVFNIVARYSEIIPGMKRFKEQKLKVVYPKPKVLISDKETLENIKMRLELGLITKAKALQILDPNLDEDEAVNEIAEIEQERMDAMSSFMDGNNAVQEEEEKETE